MAYVMRNGILVPEERLPEILIFLDETYLLNETAYLQSAVPVPADIYRQQIEPHCRSLLLQLGKDAKEFKGAKIKDGNQAIYRDFLSAFVGPTTHVAERWPLYPIVAIDATTPFSGDNFQWLRDNVIGGLANLGIHGHDDMLEEFTRQLLWLGYHYPKLSPAKLNNQVVFSFDNRHRYAQENAGFRLMFHRDLIAPVFRPLGKNVTSCANTMLGLLLKKRAPTVSRFEFGFSTKSFGLQAADIFSHLTYAALRCEMGIETHLDYLKYDLLLDVTEDFRIDATLTGALAVGKTADGRDEITCIDQSLLSTLTFSCAA